MTQSLRFCTAPDGARIAYAVGGSGPPLVRAATWLTDLEFDWQRPVWRHWLAGLAEDHTVLGYDERGCGLSDRYVGDLSLEARVADLETVIDAAGFERVVLLGISQGGPAAVAYAARHPERVSHLVLFATYARGRLLREPTSMAREQADVVASLIRLGWGRDQAAFRRLYTTLFIPEASPEQMQWFDDLERVSMEPEAALRLREARHQDDVTLAAREVASPTLVLHPRHDALVPFAEGRLLATLIPGARFVPLETRNHILLADQPAWARFLAELRAFTGACEAPVPRGLPELSIRELDVLTLVADGLSNDQIAERMYLSVRTVERHLSNVYVKLRLSGKAARAAAAVRFSRSRELAAVA